MRQPFPGNPQANTDRRRHSVLWMFVSSILAAACSSITGTIEPDESGVLSGYVRLMDTAIVGTHSEGVVVSIPSLGSTARTDSTGQWTMTGMPIGTYEVEATKQGYGRMKWFDVHVTGPGTYYLQTVTMYPTPTWHLYLDSISSNARGGINLFGTTTEPNNWSKICLCVDLDSNTLPSSSHLMQYGPSFYFQGTGRHWTYFVAASQFKNLTSGQKVYLSVFGNRGERDYLDPASWQTLPVSPSEKSNSLPYIIP